MDAPTAAGWARPLGAVVGLWVAVTTTPVAAANGVQPRVPAVFQAEACATVVDRSVDPVFHFDYAISRQDDVLTADELEDSRRFQFFAECRDHHIGESLPNWIRTDDAQRSVAAGLIEVMPSADDIVETSAWASCLLPINGANERIPITCDATQNGVDWDTQAVPVGTYKILGYTFEPALNLWSSRRGVVQVTEDGQPLPAAVLMNPPAVDARVYEEDVYPVQGCLVGPPGTTATLSWITVNDIDFEIPPDAWTDFAEISELDGFSVDFRPPPESVSKALVLRAVARSPDGVQRVGYAPNQLVIFPGTGQSDGPEQAPGPDACGVFVDDDRGDSSGGLESSDAAPAAGSAGCACRADGRDPSSLYPGWLAVVALVAWRRRRTDTPR